jgi:hypothetical protein
MSFAVDPIPEKNIITSDERGDSADSWTEPDQQSGDSPKLLLKSLGANAISSVHSPPSASLSNAKNLNLGTMSDQLAKVLPPDDGFPDLIVFVSLDNGGPGVGIFSALVKCNVKVLGFESDNDLKVALPHIGNKT